VSNASVIDRLNAALADRYRIERELGAGGMATVYLAADLKHDRKVALKVLKPELAAVLGAERFVVEIKTTASLQHPHILPLFDSGTADGFLYYVMPFIEGETLRDKLNRETQLGVDEAVRIAREVADALDYAHSKGVIHRDIKPENILIQNGRPMVADFGIALAVSAAAGGRMTETGLSLGTPHYMSPEQATADKDITARSDVYSLGSVLYEMLTGTPPHTGASAQQIIMKIIADTPRPVTELRRSVPPNVAAAIGKAIEKLPADRFENARTFGDALGNPAYVSPGMAVEAAPGAGNPWRTRFMALAAGTVLVLIGSFVAWNSARRRPDVPATYLDLSLGAVRPSGNSDVVISPDGSTIAVAGQVDGEQAIYVRRLSVDPEFRKLVGTEGSDGSPAFSPDSKWIAFRRQSDQKLVKMAVTGGSASAVANASRTTFPFVHWGTDDRLVFHGGAEAGPVLVGSAGGQTDTLGLGGAMRTTFLLPDGSGLLFTRSESLYVRDFRTDSSSLLLSFGQHPTYVESGHVLFFAENGELFAAPFDLKRHRITGQPVSAVAQVAANVLLRGYSVSRNGVLVYHDGPSALTIRTAQTRFLVITIGGATDTVRVPEGRINMPRFSPDGISIAYERFSGRGPDTDLYTFNLVTGTHTRITFDGDNDDPVWSPDSRRIVFTRGGSGSDEDIFLKAVDNSGAEDTVLALPFNQNPSQWIGNDTILFYSSAAGQGDVFMMSLEKGSQPRAYLEAPWSERDLQVSPDGKLAAFTSGEGGGTDVWIRTFPVAQGKWQVSSNQLSSVPRWSRDGNYVYYWRTSSSVADTLFRARIERTPAVVVGAPEALLAIDVAGVENWDLHPDGKRVIVTVDDLRDPLRARGASSVSRSTRYVVVQNWFTELKARTNRDKE
jgi:eukaryotic-like serine/threonine-protein kinase